MSEKKSNNKFCAINNTELMVFDEYKTPRIVAIDKLISSFAGKELNSFTTKSNLTIQEYLFEEPIFIHSVNKETNKVALNRIRSIVQYTGLKDMYKIRPYLLHSYDITYRNSIINKDFEVGNLDLQNVSNTLLLKNNKYFGKRIDRLEEIELDLDMTTGYIFGQWFSRGYVDKASKRNPKFTWVSLEEDSHTLLSLINKSFKVSTFHRGSHEGEKYDYIQIIDNEFNEKLLNIFGSNKNIANWIYSASYAFLNGLIYGIFFTNGTITFNKDKTNAYMTVKFLNQTLAERFIDLLNIRYNLQGVLSLVPDKKYCKVSFRFNKSFFKIIENGFEYGYINNENKTELIQEVKELVELPVYDSSINTECGFKVQKLTLNSGFNLKVINSKAYSLLNGIMVPSL
jgi:hypothetical protein